MRKKSKSSKTAIDRNTVLWSVISIYLILWVSLSPLAICLLPVFPYLITENGNWMFLMILSFPIGTGIGYKMWNSDYVCRYL